MTYREAMRESFVCLLTSWRLLPRYGRELLGFIVDVLWALGAALLLLMFGPALALLWAFLVLAGERKRAYLIIRVRRPRYRRCAMALALWLLCVEPRGPVRVRGRL